MKTKMPVSEPIEVRTAKDVLAAWVTPAGMICYSLTTLTGDTQQSLSNLQSKATFPRKAVPGWQDEVVAYVQAGLRAVTEIR